MRPIKKHKYIIGTADWHLSRNTPVSRTDTDYFQTALEKIKYIVELSKERDAPICIAGDIFDTIRVTPYMINELSSLLKEAPGVYTVAGQHDMENRNLSSACAYKTLEETGAIKHLTYKGRAYISGVSFTEELSSTIEAKILLLHKTITKKDPPFFLKDATRASDILKLLDKVRIVVSGDYHVPFIVYNSEQLLVNCGPLLRRGKDHLHYKPRVYCIDVETRDVETIEIPVKPVEEVFTFTVRNEAEETKPKEESEAAEGIDKVIAKLQKGELDASFENIVYALADEWGFEEKEYDILKDILSTIGDNHDK